MIIGMDDQNIRDLQRMATSEEEKNKIFKMTDFCQRFSYRDSVPDPYYGRSNYLDVPNTPLYPFGYGLSYTTFDYGDVRLSASEMTADGSIEATVRLTNSGRRDGVEVVQLYIRDRVGSSTRPVQELKGFQRVALKAGESRDVSFTIDVSLLKYYDFDLRYVAEPGEFDVMIGGASDAVKQASFTLK